MTGVSSGQNIRAECATMVATENKSTPDGAGNTATRGLATQRRGD